MRVQLNKYELKVAGYFAKARNAANRRAGVHDNVAASESKDVDVQGMIAEMALCKLWGIYPDFEVGIHPVADIILQDGRTVDVKSTYHRGGHLTATTRKQNGKASDIFALVILQRDHPGLCWFAGWAYADELMTDEHRQIARRYNVRNGWWMPQRSLRKPDTLFEKVNVGSDDDFNPFRIEPPVWAKEGQHATQ